MAILVTGGAGYIGSHMVHALVEAGERVVVLDNLSTGFDWAVAPGRAARRRARPATRRWSRACIAEHGVEPIIHFAASIVVPDSVARSARLLPQQHRQLARADRDARSRAACSHFIFSSTAAVYGNPDARAGARGRSAVPMSPYGSSKLMTEIMLRDAGAAHGLAPRDPALLQRRGRRPARRTGQSTKGATHLIKVAVETALGRRAQDRRLRHRLSDAGRHLHPRLHPRQRSRRARISTRSPICAAAAPRRRSIAATGAAFRCSR